MMRMRMSSAELYDAAIDVAEAAVRYNAARRGIINLRETARTRELEDGTPVIAQAGASAARDELKGATLELDETVEQYEAVKAKMAG
jgi:hypothetical protein